MVNALRKEKIGTIYDILVWVLIIWCILQDFVLALLLKLTGNIEIVKIIFYSKDCIMIILFAMAIVKHDLNKEIKIFFSAYYLFILCYLIISVINRNDIGLTSIMSSVRGLILLPTLTYIGYSIYNKEKFLEKIEKYYLVLVIVAVIGLIEFIADYVIGTKGFWIQWLHLDDYYLSIKGQPVLLENGTPGNWYTDIGNGYRTQKRLISIWAAPLTAGFVLLPPSVYYFIKIFKNYICNRNKISLSFVKEIVSFIICFVALTLTFTRQTWLPFLFLIGMIIVYYFRKNKKVLMGILAFAILFFAIKFNSIYNYIYNGSTKVHIMMIEKSIKTISFFGKGIATYGTRFSDGIATESQYLTIIGQIGIIPFILYMVILLYPLIYCLVNLKDNKFNLVGYSIVISGLIFCMAGMVSETVVAFTSMAQYYIFIGVIWGYLKTNGKEKNLNENKSGSNVFTSVS